MFGSRAYRILGCCLIIAGNCGAATLIGQYLFQSQGTLGVDSSGNGNDLTTSVGSPSWSSSGPGSVSSVALPTGSSLQRIPGMNNYTGASGFSYTAWVNLIDASLGYDGIVSQDFGSCCINRLMVDSSRQPYIDIGGHNDVAFASTVPNYGTWFFIALTAQTVGSTTVGRVYVNGVEVTGSPIVEPYNLPDLSTASTYLGIGEGGTTWPMNGSLADVRIYDGALTGGEVAAMYGAGAGAAAGVPEPGSAILLAAGCAAVALLRRRR
jgi:hypothetical protein